MIKKIWKDRSFRIAIIVTLAFLSIGFGCLHYGLVNYSYWIFIGLPIVVGISIGALPNKMWALIGMVLALIMFFCYLVTGGLEGMVCILMASMLVIPPLFLGTVIVYLIKRYKHIKSSTSLKELSIPFLILLVASPLDHYFHKGIEVETVSSEMVLPYTPMEVYNAIKQVDTLDVRKPLLMKLDLPIPQKCILDAEEIGALRTCYFAKGTITERVKVINPGLELSMDVVESTLPGREWLEFKEAKYFFETVGLDSCKIIRTTTYTSELYPRKYWRPMEAIGIRQEHDYVLRNLEKDLGRKN